MGGVHITQYTCENQGQLAGVGFLIPLSGSNSGLQALLAGTFTLQVLFPAQWLPGQKEVRHLS